MHRLTLGLLVACSLWAAPAHSQSYTFTTLAGDASCSSVDGLGSNARFYYPSGLALDSTGNLYVADAYNCTIRKITPDGAVSTLAGQTGVFGSADGTGPNAQFDSPGGVALDSAGNLYVADMGNSTIRKIAPGGAVTTVAGMAGVSGSADGSSSNARFNFPKGVAVDSAGNVYVADTGNHTIRRITADGTVTTLAGLAGTYGWADGSGTAARFWLPYSVRLDDAGNLYVADSSNGRIRKITPGGTVSTLARGTPNFFVPNGVALDSTGNVYVADTGNHTIRQITPAGIVNTLAGLARTSGSADGTGANARFNAPTDLVVSPTGILYVSDYNNQTIRQITPDGVVTTLAGLAKSRGGTDGTGNIARFNAPKAVAVDNTGSVFVADDNNCTIRKIAPGGVVSTLAGLARDGGTQDGPATAARFANPWAIALDSAGNLYVADSANHTIRQVTPAGVVSTLAGLAGSKGSVDGSGSNARFKNPSGLALDSAGNLYVADTSNNIIRQVTRAGVVSTLAGLAGASGNTDGAGNAARFSTPRGVAVDTTGNVYVADYANHTIRKIAPGGAVSTLAGQAGVSGSADGAGSSARFYHPGGMATDSAGNVYVADTDNCTIRRITPDGVVSTLAGRALSAGSAEGAGTDAQFYNPCGIAVDRAGNIYVADTSNNTIRLGQIVPVTPPSLRFKQGAGGFILSRPLAASNYIIETSSTLSPGATWTPLTKPLATSGDSFVLTNIVEAGARFYRLRAP